MIRAKTRWEIQHVDEGEVLHLAKETKIHPLITRLCWLRGVRTAHDLRRFLELDSFTFYDPFLLKGMKEATERIKKAIAQKEKILVYGDYDADGVSSTTIMIHLLDALNADFSYYIPDRFSEGYGLNEEAIVRAGEDGVGLIITVDTGISAYQEVETAKRLGIDVIVTDHHEPPSLIPEAYSVINPKLEDCTYPFPYLCGAGIALKLAQAMLGDVPDEWIGIAAIGTIADLVPLLDENRYIANKGLKILSHSQSPGIRALLKEAGIDQIPLESTHVGFAIGPRINASGRLERADLGVRLLTTRDPSEAARLAKKLNELNQERQELVKNIAEEAEFQASEWINKGLGHVLVVAGEDWNEGVIGIVASRLVEKFYRPTIVLSIDTEKGSAKGSARSIEGFDLYDNLLKCNDLLIKFGGHTMAAGLGIEEKRIHDFRKRINQLGQAQLSEELLIPKTKIDLVVRLEDITLSFVEQVSKLSPFGMNNPEPVLLLQDVEISSMRRVGKDGDHIKWVFQQGEYKLDCIGFRCGELMEKLSPHARIHVVGEVGINEWNGSKKPQLLFRDLAVEHLQVFDRRGTIKRLELLDEIIRHGKTAILYFKAEHRSLLENVQLPEPTVVIPIARTGETTEDGKDLDAVVQVVMFDLPETYQSLNILRQFRHLERIWCLFGSEMNQNRIRKIPTRDHFKWLYSYLYTHKTVALDNKIWEIGKRKGLSYEEMRFMIQVFLDLNFVQQVGSALIINQQPKKQTIEQSRTYQRIKERIQLETELVFSSVQDITKLFQRVMDYPADMEEAQVS